VVQQTSEAERIGINQIAKVLPRGNDRGTDQCKLISLQLLSIFCAGGAHLTCLTWYRMDLHAVTAHYRSLQAAIKMLHGRLSLLHILLKRSQTGACGLKACLTMGLREVFAPRFVLDA
jgi:hypothetical protein